MLSTYDEKDFKPAQTGVRQPLPEPDKKPRVKVETNGGSTEKT